MQDEETWVGLEASTTNWREEEKEGCECAGMGKSHYGANPRGPTGPGLPSSRVHPSGAWPRDGFPVLLTRRALHSL